MDTITFREYIGSLSSPNTLTGFPDEIINRKIDEFHFILAFATDEYDENKRGKGYFKKDWNIHHFGPHEVLALKKKFEEAHVKVKVVISIGGRGSEFPFNPREKEIWPVEAIKYLKDIIEYYKVKEKDDCGCYVNTIDGIDINYDTIECGNETDFACCIGQVIQGLKDHGLINLVSIAPSKQVRDHYKRLYQDHGDLLDYVDYQFYEEGLSPTDPNLMQKFTNLYDELQNEYKHKKVLAGFSTDPKDDGKNISRDQFIACCKELIKNGSLPGIFVWDANNSKVPKGNEDPFVAEEVSQSILVNPN